MTKIMDESDLVEFEYNELYFTVDEYINTIPSPFEKRTAKLWLSKIDQYDAKTSDEARLRNKLLHRLMHMCKNMWISEPPADIIDLKQIMQTYFPSSSPVAQIEPRTPPRRLDNSAPLEKSTQSGDVLDETSLVNKINDYFHQLYNDTVKYSNLLPNYDNKRIARMWLSKLGDYDAQTFEEADLRNEILHRLMHGCKTWQISEPFHIEPADIIDLKQIFETYFPLTPQQTGIPELFPDNSAQPFVRTGVFCYLALINRPPSEQ